MSFIGIKEHNGLCWMCSIDKANSREHKYKQSDVKSFMNIVGNSVIMIEGRKKASKWFRFSIVKVYSSYM